jgi:hypothetical protein
VIDYYAADLTDMAVQVINSWLLLQDARLSERKREMARVYIAEHLPQVRSAGAAIHAADATPLKAREAVLASPF